MREPINLLEYESLPYDKINIKKVDEFISDIKKINRRYFPKNESGDAGIFTLYKDFLKASNYVGFGKFGDVILQVLPKVYVEEKYKNTVVLLKLLDSAFNLQIKDWEYSTITHYWQNKRALYEILIYLFAKNLIMELENGFYREYTTYESTDTFLRGKLLIDKEIRKLPHEHNRFYLEKNIFNGDNLLNRVFYYTTKVGLHHTRWRKNVSMLENIAEILSDVSYRRVNIDDLNRIKFHRLNYRFKKVFELAKIILMGLQGSKESSVFGFFVDMNLLFEKHLYSVLKTHFDVRYQQVIDSLVRGLKDGERPDFIIYYEGKPQIVVDAKYKEINSSADISMNDIRQVYAYLKLLGDSAKHAALVYPSTKPNGSWEFFDGGKLHILKYDLTKIVAQEKPGIDEDFIRKLKNMVSIK